MEAAIEAIGVEQRGGVTVLTPRADLDAVRLPLLEQRFAAALAAGARQFVLDLGLVGILPSTAAGLLLVLRRRVQAAGGGIRLVGTQRAVLGTLRTMGVDTLFRIDASVQDAVYALRQREGS